MWKQQSLPPGSDARSGEYERLEVPLVSAEEPVGWKRGATTAAAATLDSWCGVAQGHAVGGW